MEILKRFLACLTSLAMLAGVGLSEYTGTNFCIKPYAASLSEHSVPSVDGGEVAVAIDQLELTPEQVREYDYQIPLFVKMTRNPGVNGIEFGVKADSELNMQIITDSKSAIEYTGNSYLSLQMTASINAEKTMAWCVWSNSTLYTDTGNLLLVVITIPHDENGNLTGGNSRDGYQYYDVTYAETGAVEPNLYGNNVNSPVQYYNDSVEYHDGWVRIKEETTSTDTTQPSQETTTATTTVPDATPLPTETTTTAATATVIITTKASSTTTTQETTTTTETTTTETTAITEDNPVNHSVPSVNGGKVAISIEQIELTKKQIEDFNYQVPLFVRMDRNPGVTGMEFGIRTASELDIESITDLSYAINYINSPYDIIPNHTLNDAVHILHTTGSFNAQGTLAWFTWSTNEVYTDTGTILLLLVTIPHDAQGNLTGGSIRNGGQYYDIVYAEEGALSSNLYGNNSEYPVLYYNDSVEYHDGWICIKEEETTTTQPETTTSTSTTTTTTTTQPETTTSTSTTTTTTTQPETTTSTSTTTTTTTTQPETTTSTSTTTTTTTTQPETTTSTSVTTTTTTTTQPETTTSTSVTTTTTTTTTQPETTTTEQKTFLMLKENEVILKTGQQYQIEANQENLTYSSSNPQIAVVSSNGVITALKEGNVVISVINQNYDVAQVNITIVMEEAPSYQLGNVNHDDAINAKDAAVVLVAAANIGAGHDSGLTKEENLAADVNADGTVNAKDAAEILVYAAVQGAGGTPSFSGKASSSK